MAWCLVKCQGLYLHLSEKLRNKKHHVLNLCGMIYVKNLYQKISVKWKDYQKGVESGIKVGERKAEDGKG
jgi:hypothetical protein